jgi:LAS superfamily LD-carboxypeptidase LdcB
MSSLRPHNYNSFSYKVTDDRIKNILQKRSQVNNAIQIGMPFVKATATVAIEEYLGPGNIGFTLGIHSLPDSGYENIFENVGNVEDPMVGYTYDRNGLPVRIYATPPSTNTIIGKYFTQGSDIQNSPLTISRIPPPGITNVTIGRNNSGLSATAELSISVPTLAQLEYLHRVFLIPSCGMVVEWGQQLALTDFAPILQREQMFPWYNRAALDAMMDRLGKRSYGIESILEGYVYPTRGQYMWMFGRVANIGTKGNADGSFDVTVTIKGPSEDQWAYSTRQTVLPPSNETNENSKPCASNANSVESYLTQTTTGGFNLQTLLTSMVDDSVPGDLSSWKGHVVRINNGNKKEGKEGEGSDPNTNQTSFADSDNAYFMTWRFFVNVVLNSKHGLKGVFARANLPDEVLNNIKFIKPYDDDGTAVPLDDPSENYVGANIYLRSYDPGTLIIVNESAAIDARSDYNYASTRGGGQSARTLLNDTVLSAATRQFLDLGGANKFDFLRSALPLDIPQSTDKGLLSTGVWLNHKAVVSSMVGASTVLQGISNLLNKMNYATKGYWALTLDSAEPVNPGDTYDWAVVDQNYKESSETAIKELTEKNKIYTFNKFLRALSTGSNFVGSELTEFSIDMNLPKLLFSQISTMGISQAGDLEKAGSDSPIIRACKNGTISDPNDTLRTMFGITTVSTKPGFKSVDLTRVSTPKSVSSCGNSAAGAAPAGSAGVGVQVVAPSPNDSDSTEKLKKKQVEIKEYLDDPDNFCQKCEPCFSSSIYPSTASQLPPTPVSNVGAIRPTMQGSVKTFPNAQVPLTVMTPINGTATYRVGRSSNTAANARYQGKLWLEKEAASQFQKLIAHASTANPPCPAFTVSSAYRDLEHQRSITTGGAAKPGSSPHGMGRAIDFSELYQAVGGSTNPVQNARVRNENNLYKWLAANAPAFGWYNPKRLADGFGIDECWHWEYWGYEYAPTNTPAPVELPVQLNQTSQKNNCTEKLLIEVGTEGIDFRFTRASKIEGGRIRCSKAETNCRRKVAELQQLTVQVQSAEEFDNAVATAVREFPNLNILLRYIEILPEHMMAKIRCSANGNNSNAFGAAPGTLSIKAELTLPGIAGLRVGELFWIDKIPAYYKIFGAFQIMSIQEVIGVDGWQTKISAVFNYLGHSWKNTMLRLIPMSASVVDVVEADGVE